MNEKVNRSQIDAGKVNHSIGNDPWGRGTFHKSKRLAAEYNGKLNRVMECGYKVDKSLHHVSPCGRITNNRNPAGDIKGSDLRLDQKEKTVVAKKKKACGWSYFRWSVSVNV